MEISIIVSNFNSEKYLDQCVKSLLDQRGIGEYEIIIIDDCSTDGSWEYIDQLSSNKLVKIRNETNIGASASRNKGLTIAKGDFICFTDSDDFVTTIYLKTLLSLINSHKDIDMAVSPFFGYFGDDKETKIENEQAGLFDATALIEKLIKFRFSLIVWNKIYKRSIISDYNIRFEEGLYNEDILFNYQYLLKCNKILIGDSPCYYYRIHNESLTNGLYKPLLKDMIFIYDFIKNDSRKNYYKDHLYKYFSIRLVVIIGLKRIIKKWTLRKNEFVLLKQFARKELLLKDVLLPDLTIKEKAVVIFVKVISTIS